MELVSTRVLVTGGARGMGRHFTKRLREAGSAVAFCDIDPGAVAATSAELDVPGIVADVSREEDVSRMFDEATAALGGPLNGLIANAGITRDGLLLKRDRQSGEVRVLSKERWDAVLAVNLTGPFLCMREFAQRAVEAEVGPAVAVHMSSISRAGNVGQSNYSAAKAGLVADTRVWARELARYDVRVGAIAPGFVDTPMVADVPEAVLGKILQQVPLRRLIPPDSIWKAVRFVFECDDFTGRVVEVDGGLVL